jgi:PAS domain S-box-containing protein
MSQALLSGTGSENAIVVRPFRIPLAHAATPAILAAVCAALALGAGQRSALFSLSVASVALAGIVILILTRSRGRVGDRDQIHRRIVELSDGGICLTDADGKLSYVNPRFAAMLKYTPHALAGRSVRDFMPREDRGAFERSLDSRAASRRTVRTEVRMVCSDGSPLYAVADLSTLLEDDRIIGTVMTLTERQLDVPVEDPPIVPSTEDVAATFLDSLTHDLRAPLQAIERLARELEVEPRRTDLLHRIRTAATRMQVVLDASQTRATGPLRCERVDLSATARIAAAELQDGSRSIAFEIENDVIVDGDGHLLRVAMEILIGHAFDCTANMADARIAFGTTEVDGSTTYFVRHQGVGFEPTSVRRRADDRHAGLSTVQRIVSRHAGRTWGRGTPDHATFFFTLESRARAE